MEEIASAELVALGASATETVHGGLYFEGDQDTLYRAHLWLRTGNRILLPLRSFPCHSPEDLYENLIKFKWETFLRGDFTFAVDCTISGRGTPSLSHSHYAKLKAKDAIVDRLREKTGSRPDVDQEDPDINVVIYIRDGICTLNMDATGDSLHERGYRPRGAEAPLKETLAAGILKLAGWDPATPLIDPMCGSGTFLAEAALMATDTAPGLFRGRFLFMNWPDFHEPRWEKWLAEAEARRKPLQAGQLFGYDEYPEAIRASQGTMRRLGVADEVLLERRDFKDFVLPENLTPGALVVNPPYGERLGEEEELKSLYKSLGDTFKQQLKGWKAGVFTGSPVLAKSIGLRPTRRIPLFNGPIECRLLTYDLY
jgi:putative N6-adenine-specific DNA methylase